MTKDASCKKCGDTSLNHVLNKTRGYCADCYLAMLFNFRKEGEIGKKELVSRVLYGLEKSSIPTLLEMSNEELLDALAQELSFHPADDDDKEWNNGWIAWPGDWHKEPLPKGYKEAAIALRKILAERKKS